MWGEGRAKDDSNHIFFSCAAAQFLWSFSRKAVGGDGCHNNFLRYFSEIQPSRRILVCPVGSEQGCSCGLYKQSTINSWLSISSLAAPLMRFIKCVSSCSYGDRSVSECLVWTSTLSSLLFAPSLFIWRPYILPSWSGAWLAAFDYLGPCLCCCFNIIFTIILSLSAVWLYNLFFIYKAVRKVFLGITLNMYRMYAHCIALHERKN